MKKLLISALFLMIGCGGSPMASEEVKMFSLKNIAQEKWDKLAQKKIYFGHQSVGFNIVDGIEDVAQENNNIKLNIVKAKTIKNTQAAFMHSTVGKNKDPNSKCDSFRDILQQGVGDWADIAFMKYCYVDVVEAGAGQAALTNQEIFDYYKNTMAQLQISYPNLKIVHVTVPLRAISTGFVSKVKNQIKRLIGRRIPAEDDNVKREEFNKLLLQQYEGKELVFDLAKIESVYPDGSREIFHKNDKVYHAVVPAYTYDGGHLNELGSKVVAEQLLIFLARIK